MLSAYQSLVAVIGGGSVFACRCGDGGGSGGGGGWHNGGGRGGDGGGGGSGDFGRKFRGLFVGDCVVTIYSNLFPSGHYLI